jgi:hypothetical protein
MRTLSFICLGGCIGNFIGGEVTNNIPLILNTIPFFIFFNLYCFDKAHSMRDKWKRKKELININEEPTAKGL